MKFCEGNYYLGLSKGQIISKATYGILNSSEKRTFAQFFTQNKDELVCQFISWTNWANSGKFICWISCQIMADIKKIYDDLIVLVAMFSPALT